MQTHSFFKRTSDYWCGNWYGELVEVGLVKLAPDTDEHRVSVWGNDDMGMVKDYLTKQEALTMFIHLTTLEDLSIDVLTELGFLDFNLA